MTYPAQKDGGTDAANKEQTQLLERMSTSLEEQTEDLCHIHDHVTRIIANLDINDEWFTDYGDPGRAKFDLNAVVQMFVYQYARGFSQPQLARRLRGVAYVYIRFGLGQPLSQQIISYNWRERFTIIERKAIKEVATRIREICSEHDVIRTDEPALDPDDIDTEHGIGEDLIMEAVELATELGFDEFSDPRAPNIKYELQAYFERQGYLSMSRAGTTTKRRRFARLSDRNEVPHGSSHNRTMKKVGSPDSQTELWQFEDRQKPPDWRRIRDAILPVFHRGLEKQLDEIAGRDRQGIRQPVIAAIDITTFDFWPSPLRDDSDVEPGEKPVKTEHGEVYPKDDFPEMVSGFKKGNKKKTERGYKFATITIVAEDTPIVLGIEPVRDYRWWERLEKQEVETTSRMMIVARLLEQATQHVEINKMLCDREFDIHGVRDLLDRRNIQYVTGKQKRSNADYKNIEEILEDPVYDSRIEHTWGWYEGRRHKVSIIYKPGGEYSIFTVNGWVDPDRAEGLIGQYRHRWQTENSYKTIKENFLPQTATTDYRVRFLYFIISVMMYNVWRLTNFLLRDKVDVNLGEDPPLPAGEVVELVGFFLFDPGG